ncbi:CBS domain-containing protein [Spongiactinospora sp. TRM90649]|uniref:CBS domain-containing protein n=1 Tax=Spongiactinospora sp. TRM90649 TaxID=3031114 RepID=UPI0023F810B5|nr:CBS domain-containing protein [Spongiactinospora sp. TRM90649]MDF5755201.1 CBS domain-containing protein [Spongiactinospora sp. TRM90649]
MLVREVMTTQVIMLHRDDAIRHAVRVLYRHGITAAPVVNDAGDLIGIVSELDLLGGEFEPDPRAHAVPVHPAGTRPPRRVAEVMNRDVVTVIETTDIVDLINIMITERIKSVPVLSGERVAGIVSRHDVLGMLARSDDELRDDVVAVLREHYPSGPGWQVDVREGIARLHGHAADRVDVIADLLTQTVPGVVRVEHTG